MAEKIGEVLNRIQGSMTAFPKSQSKADCRICGVVFKYEEKYVSGKGWLIPVCCSDKCKETYRQRKLEKAMPVLMTKAGVPFKYRELKTDKVKLLAETVDNRRSIYAWGNAGTGKTVFACSAIRALIQKHSILSIKFISSPKLIMELQDLYCKEGESAWDYLQEITTESVLVLDDLGAEKITSFVRQALYYLINEREQWQRQTIITSNYSLEQLDEYIDGRISSRIAGMCKVVQFQGKDRRISTTA